MRQTKDALENLSSIKAKALTLEGLEKHSQRPLTALYLGNGENLSYLQGVLYRGCKSTLTVPRISTLRMNGFLAKESLDADLLIVDIDWPWDRRISTPGFLRVPSYVEQVLPLPQSWPEVRARFNRNLKKTKLRKIRQKGLGFRVVSSAAALSHFYHQMYVPFVKQRHGSSAYIEPESQVMRAGREGRLIEIVRDESVVASGLLVDSGSTLCLTWAGMSQEVSAEKLDGAFAALYYYTILHGYELGRDHVWFGQSRPLANDGVFRYKRQWRTRVIPTSEILGDILIRPLSFSDPVQSVFANNCFIVETSTGLAARVLLAVGVAGTTEIRDLARQYGTEGVDRLEIFSLQGFEKPDGEETVDDGTVVRRVDLSRSPNPALDFCQA